MIRNKTLSFFLKKSSSESRNIFANLEKSHELDVRKIIIRAILGTDMKHQRDHVKALGM